MQVTKTKFGYFACNKLMYRKIRRLYFYYHKAVQQAANWNRWHGKKPENRVVQVKEQVDGKTVVKLVMPKAEPALVPVFTQKTAVVSYYDQDGKYVPGGFEDVKVGVCDMGILALYHAVKKPKKLSKNIPEIAHTEEEVTAMLKQITAAKHKWA